MNGKNCVWVVIHDNFSAGGGGDADAHSDDIRGIYTTSVLAEKLVAELGGDPHINAFDLSIHEWPLNTPDAGYLKS